MAFGLGTTPGLGTCHGLRDGLSVSGLEGALFGGATGEGATGASFIVPQ